MKNYYGPLMKLQNTLQFIPRRCPGLSIKESYRRYELEGVYWCPDKPFWTGSRSKHDIIGGAWSRCYLNQETAYATL